MEFRKIQTIIASVLQLDIVELTDDANLVSDLGADSLEIFSIISGMEKEFDISISNASIDNGTTIGDLYHLVMKEK